MVPRALSPPFTEPTTSIRTVILSSSRRCLSMDADKMKDRKKVDGEKQYLVVLDAFSKNGYFVLIDSIQAESLEQMVVINDETEVSFVKLTPLVGG